MARLTLNLKEKIVLNALAKAGITAAKAEAITRRADLAESVRVSGMGGASQEKYVSDMAANIAEMQEEVKKIVSVISFDMRQDYDVEAAFNGRQIDLHFNGMTCYNDSTKRVYKSPVPPGRVLFNAEHPLAEEFDAILDLELDTKTREETIRLTVLGTINQFTTIAKLIEAWPESEELLPKEEHQIGLPALQVADLNALIKLPS